jgi:hypothetical protein
MKTVGRTPWSAADALGGLLASGQILINGNSGSKGTRTDQGGPPHKRVFSRVSAPHCRLHFMSQIPAHHQWTGFAAGVTRALTPSPTL